MPSVTACHDCGAPDGQPVLEDIYCEYGHYDVLMLCRACADKREGVPSMEEQCAAEDGQGRR